ncbi:polysaccharide biosynthesis family protein [Chondrocystis sp. NIES-4102]|nr:polysaccharide biosynthesis family protein [Chondrocystis sp. NIES-4102]
MFKEFKKLLNKVKQNNFIKNSFAIFQSLILRIVVQILYFILLARTFGVEKYGYYTGIVAFVSIFIPFASWGSGEILIQKVARDRDLFQEYWGTTILKTLFFSSIFTSIILIVYSLYPVPNISIYSVFFVALGNLIFLKLNDATRDAFIAVGKLDYTAKTIVLVSISRVIVAILFVFLFEEHSVLSWCILYAIATLASAVMSTYLVVQQVSYPKFNFRHIKQDLKLGFSYAISVSAQNVYNDLDKVMLTKMSTSAANGIYTTAYQVLTVAFTPIQSLALAAFRKFFQQGASGIKGSLQLCKKILPLSVGYSLLAVLGLIICAPLLPIILGSEYQESVRALLWLSPTIVIKTIHFFAADALTGANYQSTRGTAQVLVAVINGVLNYWLIPIYGLYGAIWATLASEFLLMIFLWSFIYIYYKKSA